MDKYIDKMIDNVLEGHDPKNIINDIFNESEIDKFERVALKALFKDITKNGTVTNPEEMSYGHLNVDKKSLAKFKKLGYITHKKIGSSTKYKLTDAGIKYIQS